MVISIRRHRLKREFHLETAGPVRPGPSRAFLFRPQATPRARRRPPALGFLPRAECGLTLRLADRRSLTAKRIVVGNGGGLRRIGSYVKQLIGPTRDHTKPGIIGHAGKAE
jgi:hypothetical protein